MTLPQGGFREHRRAGRRRVTIVAALVLAAMFAWGYLVVSCDAGRTSRAEEKSPEPSVAETSVPEAPASQASSSEGHADSHSHSTAHPLEAEQLPPDELREFENRQDREDGAPSQPSAASTGPTASGESSAPAPSGPSSASAHAEGPGTYDPLGTGAEAGDLAPIDEQRARYAAAEFVTAAYGYSGDDPNAYNQGVGDTVVWPDFYDSEGSKEIESYAGQVKTTGTESAAKLSRLRVEETTGNTATGYAFFETGTGYGESGELAGKTLAYRQGMTLIRVGETWKVLSTERVEEM